MYDVKQLCYHYTNKEISKELENYKIKTHMQLRRVNNVLKSSNAETRARALSLPLSVALWLFFSLPIFVMS